MKDRLRINVSGIRGEVPGALNVEVVSKFSSAFASTLEGGQIAISRDSRQTSHMLEMAVLSSVIAAGLDCVDFGLLPTPFRIQENHRIPRNRIVPSGDGDSS